MASTYTWELGINWDARLGFEGLGFLQSGLTTFADLTETTLVSPFSLVLYQNIAFRIYDTTSSGPQTESIVAAEILSGPADSIGRRSPFAVNPIVIQSFYREPEPKKSVYFNGTFDSWLGDGIFDLENTGEFLATFMVEARNIDPQIEPRVWRVDPEMVVSENSGEIELPQALRR